MNGIETAATVSVRSLRWGSIGGRNVRNYLGQNDRVGDGGSIAFGSSHRMRKIVIGDGMSFIGVCLSVAGLAALGYQFLLWLNYGLWPPLAFWLVLKLIGAREPLFGWQRVEKISAWIFDLPLSGVLFGAALVAVIFGVAVTAGACPPGAAEGNPAASVPDAAEI